MTGWRLGRLAIGAAVLMVTAASAVAQDDGADDLGLTMDGSLGDEGVSGTRVLAVESDRAADIERLVNGIRPLFGAEEAIRYWLDGETLVLVGASDAVQCVVEALQANELLKSTRSDERPTRAAANYCASVQLYYSRSPETLAPVLESVAEKLCPKVIVTACTGSGTLPSILLTGPRDDVATMQRVIETIDRPHPQVRLELWAYDISGSNADRVAEAAIWSRRYIDGAGELVRGYISALESYAADLQEEAAPRERHEEREQTDAETARAAMRVAEMMGMLAAEQPPRSATTPDEAVPELPFEFDRDKLMELEDAIKSIIPIYVPGGGVSGVTQPPDESGTHPMSLTEVLTVLALNAPRDRRTIESEIAEHLDRWLEDADRVRNERMPEEEQLRLLAVLLQWQDRGIDPLQPLAAQLASGSDGPDTGKPSLLDLAGPKALIDLLADDRFRGAAQAALTDYVNTYEDFNAPVASALPQPGLLTRRGAEAGVVLQAMQRALESDVEAVFMEPLRGALDQITRRHGPVGGMSFSGRSSISVLSGMPATLKGSTVSYFDVSAPPQLTTETLTRAQEIGAALTETFPHSSGRGRARYALRVDLRGMHTAGAAVPGNVSDWIDYVRNSVPDLQVMQVGGGSSLMLTGTMDQVTAGRELLAAMGATGGQEPMQIGTASAGTSQPMSALTSGGSGGIPTDRLLGLALALGQEERTWAALKDGVELVFTPNVLPGGSAAELQVKCTISHDQDDDAGGGAGDPISRVARHEANTRVYIDSLDLFGLSSLDMVTTRSRPDVSVPLLGQLPLLGAMFRFPRGPKTVHHQSLLVVQASVLVTGDALGELLVKVSPPSTARPPG